MAQAVFLDEDSAGVTGHRDLTRALARRLLALSPRVAVLAVVDLWPEKFAEAFLPLLDTGTDIVAFSTNGVFSGGKLVEGRPAVAGLCFDEGAAVARFDASGVLRGEPPALQARNAVLFSTPRLVGMQAFEKVKRVFDPQAPLHFTGGFTMEDNRGRSWVWDRNGMHESGFVALLSGAPGHTVLSQGMRVLGEPFLVTRAEGVWLEELAFQPALERLENALEQEGANVDAQLFVGFPYDQAGQLNDPEAFVAHPVLGVDRDRGALRLGMEPPMGVPGQLMAKNAQSASLGLSRMTDELLQKGLRPPWGVATCCCARNSRFFGAFPGDAATLKPLFEQGPHLGWYANGEFFYDHRGLQLVQFSTVLNISGEG